MEEFAQAYHQVVQGRPNYIIVVLLEKPGPNKLPPELETYLTTHTYIDARKYADEMETIRKRVRFALPKISRKELLVRKINRLREHYLYLFHTQLHIPILIPRNILMKQFTNVFDLNASDFQRRVIGQRNQ